MDLFTLSSMTHRNSKEIELLISKEIMLNPGDNIISSESQPTNGTIYSALWNTTSITLPSAENFKNYGFRVVILCVNSNIFLNMASEYSTDIITFQGISYTKSLGNFILNNRGFIELMWCSSGWIVLNSFGLTFNHLKF